MCAVVKWMEYGWITRCRKSHFSGSYAIQYDVFEPMKRLQLFEIVILECAHLFMCIHTTNGLTTKTTKFHLFSWITLELHGIKMVKHVQWLHGWLCLRAVLLLLLCVDHLHTWWCFFSIVDGGPEFGGETFADVTNERKGRPETWFVFIWVLFAYFN